MRSDMIDAGRSVSSRAIDTLPRLWDASKELFLGVVLTALRQDNLAINRTIRYTTECRSRLPHGESSHCSDSASKAACNSMCIVSRLFSMSPH